MKRIISKKDYALFVELVRTDFKLRYQGSVLGYLWSLVKPLMLFAILYVVFTQFLRIGKDVPNYPISLLLGIVLWTFFVEATNSSLKSIVGRGSLIRKINIPRYLIPYSTVASAFINLFFNLIVVFVFILFASGTALSWQTIILLPLLIVQLTLLSTGVGLFLAALYVKYRDVNHLWEVARQALFYTVPIIYPLSIITHEIIQKIIILNPLAQIIQNARVITTYSGTTTINDLYGNRLFELIPIGLSIGVFALGYIYFQRQSKDFAEIV